MDHQAVALMLLAVAVVILFGTALWAAWKNSAEGKEFILLYSLAGVPAMVAAVVNEAPDLWWLGIPLGVACGPVAYWVAKIQRRRQAHRQLYRPTPPRNVTLVLLVFGTMAAVFAAWWVIGEMSALIPMLAIALALQWIVLAVLVWRWRREDKQGHTARS